MSRTDAVAALPYQPPPRLDCRSWWSTTCHGQYRCVCIWAQLMHPVPGKNRVQRSQVAVCVPRCFINATHVLPQSLDDAAPWLGGLHCRQDGLVQRCWQQHCDSIHRQHTASCSEEGETSAEDGAAHAWLPTNEQQWQQAWGLPDHSLVPAWRQGGPELRQLEPVAGWQQYYDLRQLPHSSPAGRYRSGCGSWFAGGLSQLCCDVG